MWDDPILTVIDDGDDDEPRFTRIGEGEELELDIEPVAPEPVRAPIRPLCLGQRRERDDTVLRVALFIITVLLAAAVFVWDHGPGAPAGTNGARATDEYPSTTTQLSAIH